MRIRWRGLELPNRVVCDDSVSTKLYARFVIEPFEQGFGTTIGNSLRRVLLSSLEGAAVTSVKIEGVSHEFTSIDGVLEDVTDILLNIKGILIRLDSDTSQTVCVSRETAGEVLAGDIESDENLTVENPEYRIATLTADVPFRMEMTVAKGRGYVTAAEHRTRESELGVLPVDSVFSPVLRVRYRTEDMRVGQRTNYDRLILEVWTNGTVTPQDALVEAGLILRKHLNPIVMYSKLGERLVSSDAKPVDTRDSDADTMAGLLDKPISVLNLSVRASNCLDAGKIGTLRELVVRTDADLLRFRSFGKTSLHEIHRKLSEIGLSLGMKLDQPGTADPNDPGLPAGQNATGASVPAETGPMEAFTMGE